MLHHSLQILGHQIIPVYLASASQSFQVKEAVHLHFLAQSWTHRFTRITHLGRNVCGLLGNHCQSSSIFN